MCQGRFHSAFRYRKRGLIHWSRFTFAQGVTQILACVTAYMSIFVVLVGIPSPPNRILAPKCHDGPLPVVHGTLHSLPAHDGAAELNVCRNRAPPTTLHLCPRRSQDGFIYDHSQGGWADPSMSIMVFTGLWACKLIDPSSGRTRPAGAGG